MADAHRFYVETRREDTTLLTKGRRPGDNSAKSVVRNKFRLCGLVAASSNWWAVENKTQTFSGLRFTVGELSSFVLT